MTGFTRSEEGEKGPAEASGRIQPGDVLSSVNNGPLLQTMHFKDAIREIRTAKWPMQLRLVRPSDADVSVRAAPDHEDWLLHREPFVSEPSRRRVEVRGTCVDVLAPTTGRPGTRSADPQPLYSVDLRDCFAVQRVFDARATTGSQQFAVAIHAADPADCEAAEDADRKRIQLEQEAAARTDPEQALAQAMAAARASQQADDPLSGDGSGQGGDGDDAAAAERANRKRLRYAHVVYFSSAEARDEWWRIIQEQVQHAKADDPEGSEIPVSFHEEVVSFRLEAADIQRGVLSRDPFDGSLHARTLEVTRTRIRIVVPGEAGGVEQTIPLAGMSKAFVMHSVADGSAPVGGDRIPSVLGCSLDDVDLRVRVILQWRSHQSQLAGFRDQEDANGFAASVAEAASADGARRVDHADSVEWDGAMPAVAEAEPQGEKGEEEPAESEDKRQNDLRNAVDLLTGTPMVRAPLLVEFGSGSWNGLDPSCLPSPVCS